MLIELVGGPEDGRVINPDWPPLMHLHWPVNSAPLLKPWDVHQLVNEELTTVIYRLTSRPRADGRGSELVYVYGPHYGAFMRRWWG